MHRGGLDARRHARIGSRPDRPLHDVDVTNLFAGGEACSRDRTYMHEIVPGNLVFSFHPTVEGQRLLATRLAEAIAGA